MAGMDRNLHTMRRNRANRGLTLDELKMEALICFRNADEILEDADLLFSDKRYARTVFLSCIGIEELGKSTLCLELFEANWQFDTDDKIKKFWGFWYHHQSKAAHGFGYMALDPDELEKAGRTLLPNKYLNWKDYEKQKKDFYKEYSGISTRLKESSIYTDFVDRGQHNKKSGFKLPSQIFEEKHAKTFLQNLREQIEELRPRIKNVGYLHLPPYPPGVEYEGL